MISLVLGDCIKELKSMVTILLIWLLLTLLTMWVKTMEMIVIARILIII